jgi:hypothetical protein
MAKPSVEYEYEAKKDRLEITIKHYSLKKIRAQGPDEEPSSKARRGCRPRQEGQARGKLTKNPWKETKIPEVGD